MIQHVRRWNRISFAMAWAAAFEVQVSGGGRVRGGVPTCGQLGKVLWFRGLAICVNLGVRFAVGCAGCQNAGQIKT